MAEIKLVRWRKGNKRNEQKTEKNVRLKFLKRGGVEKKETAPCAQYSFAFSGCGRFQPSLWVYILHGLSVRAHGRHIFVFPPLHVNFAPI